ncbi:MAG: cation-translocating P-type ATPase [Acidiferrobacterales bacterium]|nr:cation-translocating P-type ATPase [Acidiferrobacterales bacterium]
MRSVENSGEKPSNIFTVNNISCGGCVPRVEADFRTIPGVVQAEMHSVSRRAHIVWDPAKTNLRKLMEDIEALGWEVEPYTARTQEVRMKQESKRFLAQILLAAGLGMQVMMITVAMYFGEYYWMNETVRHVLRVTAMCLTLPVLLFSATPFITGAWSSVKRGALNVDVPVTIALFLAFSGSVLSTFWLEGEVYFESVVMFTLLLLSARYLELLSRKHGLSAVMLMEKSLPEFAIRVSPDRGAEKVPIGYLQPGDEVMVEPGGTIPADGEITRGNSNINESIVTGESIPVLKREGDKVIAGSINESEYLRVKAHVIGDESVIGRLIRLTDSAQSRKPRLAKAADQIAMHFVVGLIIMASFAGVYWWFEDKELWLPVVISTLVVACPCALSLATPTAFVAAMNNLISRGALPIKSESLEQVADIDHVIFDKTGTLTTGTFEVTNICIAEGENEQQIIKTAARILNLSRHPVARAIVKLGGEVCESPVNLNQHPGGIRATVEGDEYVAGSVAFLRSALGASDAGSCWFDMDSTRTICLLARNGAIIARFELRDQIRPDAFQVVSFLQSRGIVVSLRSGDQQLAVQAVAESLGIRLYQAELTPDEKLEEVRALQERGVRVMMVGDGLNDAPAMAVSDFSIAMGSGIDMTKLTADLVLANNALLTLLDLLYLSSSTKRIIKQNYAWASLYNLLAIPAAIFGLVPPWLAALGMSASSLLVVLNSLRLLSSRQKRAMNGGQGRNGPLAVGDMIRV